ncbi:MAG TPA: V-type ATPase 116kDa subunit family protein [Gaiellaceae bacterium]|nr:V-type ATPase 116kDa subunit family protein [Gaiellaceae bacterium]
MTRVEIVSRMPRLGQVLQRLYQLRLLQLEPAVDEAGATLTVVPGNSARQAQVSELRLLLARLDGLLALTESVTAPSEGDPDIQPAAVTAELDRIAPHIESSAARIDELQSELAVLPRYLEPLRRLLPLVPELAMLDEQELRALRLDTVALVLNTDDDRLVENLRAALQELVGERFELVATRVDADAVGCLIVVAHRDADTVRELLGREQVRHLPLPQRYERLSFHGAVAAMETRLRDLPPKLERAKADLQELLAPRASGWDAARIHLAAQLEQLEAVVNLGATERTFVAVGWTPTSQLPKLRNELELAASEEIALDVVDPTPGVTPPVLMSNRAPARPFEFLVRLLDLPRAGSLDPTMLMALFLPLMVGVMVGDIVYGALLLGLAVFARQRFASRSPVIRDLTRVFIAGSLWAIVFGVLYGEALGDLGERFGLHALWFYRGGRDAVQRLLLFSLAIGAAHVVLGLVLGLWRSALERRGGELLERAGSLLALGGVFGLAGVAVDRLPGGALVPAAAAIVVGIVLLVVPGGALGLMMGPLAFIGTLGNVLSYLRLAAVGLASAYLAVVANRLGGLGPIWMGVFVAALFHALNLALAAFSPMIQALRLHYVEFFSKFYEGGGEPFRPFGERGVA